MVDSRNHSHSASGHWQKLNEDSHYDTCSVCGDTINTAPHQWTGWTVSGNIEYRTCPVCGARQEQAHITHEHTIITVRMDSHAIDDSTCQTTVVTECSDPNCTDANHMHNETTTTQGHNFVEDSGAAVDLGGGLLLVPTRCSHCGYPGPDKYVDTTLGSKLNNRKNYKISPFKIDLGDYLCYFDGKQEDMENVKVKKYSNRA